MKGDSTKARAMRGSLWTILGHATSQGIRLASNLILTRLLFPEVFGVMAIVQVVLQGLVMFSDVGLAPSIVRSKNTSDPRFLNTAWTVQLIRNSLLLLLTIGIAFLLANFYEKPELAYLIPLSGLSLLVNGMFPIKVILASRQMNLFRVTFIQLIGQGVGIAMSVALAFYYKNALIFVVGSVTGEVVRLVLYRLYLPGNNNRLQIYAPALKELLSFGKWMVLASAFGFLAQQANVFILGKYLDGNSFGIYTVALVLAMLPFTVCQILNNKVLLPLFSEMHRDGAEKSSILKGRYTVLAGNALAVITLMFISPFFFQILYDERYALAGYISLVVLFSILPEMLLMVTQNKLLVEGRSLEYAALNGLKAALLIALGLLWVKDHGVLGVSAAVFVSGLVTYFLTLTTKGTTQIIKLSYEVLIVLAYAVAALLCMYLYSEGLIKVMELR
jgi:O-antigen/teichoic acid export membrane protein